MMTVISGSSMPVVNERILRSIFVYIVYYFHEPPLKNYFDSVIICWRGE